MEPIAEKKVHFAPFVRQVRAMRRLLREGRFRDATEFLRSAIDHYLDHLGRPPLSDQARLMAEDFARERTDPSTDPSHLQDASRDAPEDW